MASLLQHLILIQVLHLLHLAKLMLLQLASFQILPFSKLIYFLPSDELLWRISSKQSSMFALLGGEISPPHLLLLLLMQVPADDGEPKKFHPLDSFAHKDFLKVPKGFISINLATSTALAISGIDKESLLDKELTLRPFSLNHLKISQLEDISGSSFGWHFSFYKLLICSSLLVNLACTIYWESPCPSTPASVIKSCHNDAYGESKDYITPILSLFNLVGCIPLIEHYRDGPQYYSRIVKVVHDHDDKVD